jgi:hypothetical protein
MGGVARVLYFEPCTKLSLERCKPCGIVAGCGNVVHVKCDHGENVTGAEGVDAWVGYALLPPIFDKPCTKEHVELARGMFQAVEAALEMTHFRRAISEVEGLVNVHVLLDWGVEERSVDVKMAQFKVAGGRDGKEEAKVGHADVRGERFRVVEANALAAPFGDEPRFEAEDIANGIGLDVVDPHVVNDHAARGKVDEFPRAVVDEGGVLPLHSGLPLGESRNGFIRMATKHVCLGKSHRSVV